MLYTLSDKIFPVYFEDFLFDEQKLLYRSINPIPSRSIQALHYHRYLELGICLAGRGITYIDNRCYRFSEGDMVVTPANIPHLSAAEPGVNSTWHWISLNPMEILSKCGFSNMELLEKLSVNGFSGVFHPWEHTQLAELIRKISEVDVKEGELGKLECAFLAGQLLLECVRIGNAEQESSKSITSAVKVAPALSYIRAYYADKEAVKEERIADVCHMSVSHFRATFKKETGMTVRDFIIQTRLATAAHLLMSTDMNVINIAMETGFGQISCFNRIFSREFGKTPTAFRKKFRAQIDDTESKSSLDKSTYI